MKKIYNILLLMLLTVSLYSQTPQAIKYQAVVRDADGSLIKNQKVSYEISILAGSSTGTVVYTETHTDTTNEFGVSNLLIGKGTPVLSTFSAINWASNDYFVKISIDLYGGTSYMVMGTSQLMSVPYALYAENANSLDGKTSSYFANSSHTHSEYASASHTHPGLSMVPVLQANVRYDATCSYGCYNVESLAWNSTLGRYEIEISDFYYSIDDIAFISIAGDASSCPAGSDARQTSVGGKLLVYIVNASGANIQCSFDVIAFAGHSN